MSKKSKKRSTHRVVKKSWLEKFFTFPKLAVFGFLILSVFTVYQITKPQDKVLGVVDENAMLTRDEAIALVKKQTSAGVPIDKFIAVYLWRDADRDAKWDGDEDCAKKQFTVKKNGITKTPTQGDCNFPARYFKATNKECNTITFVKTNTSNKYVYTGMNVTDKNRPNGKPIPGLAKSVEVCGFPKSTGGDGWGFMYNEVKIGVKGD